MRVSSGRVGEIGEVGAKQEERVKWSNYGGASLNLTQRYLTAKSGGGAVSTGDGRGTEEATSR